MFTWKKDFQCQRPDGRWIGSLGAWFARLRDMKPALAYDADALATPAAFQAWRQQVKAKLAELLRMPAESQPQPPPKMISSAPRDGYHLERWEFYPDPYTAVPVLLLRPDGLAAPAPGVLCCPGSACPKEQLAGEPMPENPNCHNYKFTERNAQALHCVKQGYIAVAFDNPGTAELAELGDSGKETNWELRTKLVQAYLDSGTTYLGVSVAQKLRFLDWFKQMPGVDASRLAVMGHSLGSEPAMCIGVLRDDIKAVVFNDFLCDTRQRFCAYTDFETADDGGNWHHVPGMWTQFAFPDILASLAPKYLTINEGGSKEALDKVRRSYAAVGAADRLQINKYPRFADTPEETGPIPNNGRHFKTHNEKWYQVDVPDHSFRPAPSMRLLAKAFATP